MYIYLSKKNHNAIFIFLPSRVIHDMLTVSDLKASRKLYNYGQILEKYKIYCLAYMFSF